MLKKANKTIADAFDLTNWFISIADERGIEMNLTKMRILFYYAVAHYLQKYDTLLTTEPIYKWPVAPTILSVYRNFKNVALSPRVKPVSTVYQVPGEEMVRLWEPEDSFFLAKKQAPDFADSAGYSLERFGQMLTNDLEVRLYKEPGYVRAGKDGILSHQLVFTREDLLRANTLYDCEF